MRKIELQILRVILNIIIHSTVLGSSKIVRTCMGVCFFVIYHVDGPIVLNCLLTY